MAYHSGYGGYITWVGSPAPTWSTFITDWRIHFEVRSHETFVKYWVGTGAYGQPSSITGAVRWVATAQFLMDDTLDRVDMSLYGNTAPREVEVEVKFHFDATDYFHGTANMVSYDIAAPLDGPGMATARLIGVERLLQYPAS